MGTGPSRPRCSLWPVVGSTLHTAGTPLPLEMGDLFAVHPVGKVVFERRRARPRRRAQQRHPEERQAPRQFPRCRASEEHHAPITKYRAISHTTTTRPGSARRRAFHRCKAISRLMLATRVRWHRSVESRSRAAERSARTNQELCPRPQRWILSRQPSTASTM